MESSVLGQIAGGSECLGTILTSVGLLPGMSPAVSLQYFTAGESFVTESALEFILGKV